MQTDIILIEDDPEQSEGIRRSIMEHRPDTKVIVLETESDLYARINAIPVDSPHPSLVVSDVMFPWASPDPDAPVAPAEVIKGTFRNAGTRGWARFRSRKDLRSVPWIYFTVLDVKTIDFKGHSDARTVYVHKGGSIRPLLEQIDNFLLLDQRWDESDEQVTQRLSESPAMRGILVNALTMSLDDCQPILP